MRTVNVFKVAPYNDLSDEEKKVFQKHRSTGWALVPDGTGLFHQWGFSYEEFESGPGNYTVAIVERPDGTIEAIDPEFIQFTDKHQQEYELTLEEFQKKIPEYSRVQLEIEALQHFEAIVTGMWATDRPDLLTDEEKARCHLFKIEGRVYNKKCEADLINTCAHIDPCCDACNEECVRAGFREKGQ